MDTLAVLDWKSYFRWGDIKLRTREKKTKVPVKNKSGMKNSESVDVQTNNCPSKKYPKREN